jgi:hypothetical protein
VNSSSFSQKELNTNDNISEKYVNNVSNVNRNQRSIIVISLDLLYTFIETYTSFKNYVNYVLYDITTKSMAQQFVPSVTLTF